MTEPSDKRRRMFIILRLLSSVSLVYKIRRLFRQPEGLLICHFFIYGSGKFSEPFPVLFRAERYSNIKKQKNQYVGIIILKTTICGGFFRCTKNGTGGPEGLRPGSLDTQRFPAVKNIQKFLKKLLTSLFYYDILCRHVDFKG